ncbi:MAG: MurR/RpiR family transcriptional regulator [Castellaniella sp.]|uniref:MurR/RpiR family transcriptional regulator n=1 Tax=Castellaniella sp. TaxID=1955812 RepID=UPI003C76D153
MKHTARRSFLARVRAALPTLHPAERRLGEFLCDFPGELASYDAQELAQLAQVSKATVSRFVRRLDYSNYEEARRHAREEQQTGSRLFMPSAKSPQAANALGDHLQQGKDNIDQTFSTLTLDDIDAVARSMLAARKTWIIGFRASRPLADYLRWQLMQVIEHVVSLPGSGETLGEYLARIEPHDCVLLFGLRRRVSHNRPLLDFLRKTQATLIYITDEGAETVKGVHRHFRCHTAAGGPLFNHVSVMALCHLLAMRTIELSDTQGRDRLRQIETANDILDEL